ncbi:MAG: hypothetical protein RLZZ195_283 [Pseudomonadota bacterium]|jgi:hypothetical protein
MNVFDDKNSLYYISETNYKNRHEQDDDFFIKRMSEPLSKIIALGCSNTYGVAVPKEFLWPTTIEEKTGLSVANLAFPGNSAKDCLDIFLEYIDNVGIPEYVFASLPDPLRYQHVVDRFYYKNFYNNVEARTRTSYLIKDGPEEKYLKLPAIPHSTIAPENGIQQFFSSVYTIQTICKLLNIKFYWSSWDFNTLNITKKLLYISNKLDSKYFLHEKHAPMFHYTKTKDYTAFNQHKHSENLCYVEHESKLLGEDIYHIGSDGLHMGVHWHDHVAESFIEKI